MPIGGLREKTMAALRAGLHTVILPLENEKDLDDIDQSVRAKLRFVTVETVDAVFAEALVLPETLSGKGLDEAFLDQGDSILVPALRV
jgi:ATP-dependent Lon protease